MDIAKLEQLKLDVAALSPEDYRKLRQWFDTFVAEMDKKENGGAKSHSDR